jgi:hypothetical protein
MLRIKLFVLTSLLLALTGVTAHVVDDSLPGDSLFMLKTEFENVHVGLADRPNVRARLHLQFASRRASEFNSLLVQGRYADLALASSEFARHIQQASSLARDMSHVDPSRESALHGEILVVIQGYSVLLAQHLGDIPGSIRPVVEKAEIVPEPLISGSHLGTVNPGLPTPLPTMTPILLILSTRTPVSSLASPQIGTINP